MSRWSALHTRELPPPSGLTRMLGVGVIVMGMAMGTGELILWPHLVSKFGLGILWLALIGLALQYFINQEVARHTAATGESFFTSSARLIHYIPLFWIVAAVLLYVWPGWASALGTILARLFGFGSYLIWSWLSLALVLIITFSGRTAYHVLERALKIIVPLFLLLLLIVSYHNLTPGVLLEALKGLVNIGYIPEGIDMNVLLGAIVFAGAGGMLNLATSLWYRDKGLGMAHYVGRITNPITGAPEAVTVTGQDFHITEESLARWRGWMRYVRIDQGLIFFTLGLISLVLLSVNAYVVLTPLGIVPEGTNVAVAQAEIFAAQWGALGEKLYLLMAYLMLFSVMWTVIDALTRIITDIVHTNAREGALREQFRWMNSISIHHLYYGLIVCIVFIQALLLPFNQPLPFLVLSSALGGITMALYTPLLLYLNLFKLPWPLRPGIITICALLAGTLFYAFFAFQSISATIGG
ncbi:MAG: hypothetical protein UY68_C0006G0018 [Parcubacteria group bacterium GW2011_GWF2_52_12]|uniref:Amino acid transporter transmembrane domain-containing protein n=1 Tax=Candidatus Vogelbacteria bacterium RIFOXYD1_FULL_51_18 TaxID=1802440 RepID=A0A1G2QJB5_9BACT|nr:MAG: hypothetical protein UY66_C0006G0006 [Parcubacteria group bacterium GW2011_GWC1_51_35]KKW24941.1 MAG: hypothetical protein UY68_C0006G0018 [Parcubacteria group bacterium GW2011_GWF2_52_12]KKW26519.1 MAG: hypothetical protein UY69_C0021G0011 [Parcubacteria group bacterium GW2011_GWF1_52_5]KKW33555.1 MAG: hypothetical protein UY80_C0039G0007 [Parcubacteria group bacterium GW2011_GWB1_53_43]OHA60700.1 MAG: hypothetical protein A2569_00260 [Candidatus Vogelbacteria bacterium RIFOXYD1_FULL_5